MAAKTAQDIPVACALRDAELEERVTDIRPLLATTEEICELDDGYAFRFAAETETAAALLDFALFERRCCAFLSFELILEAAHGPLWLQIRGSSPGAKEFAAGFIPER
jgi:hypothetical protein